MKETNWNDHFALSVAYVKDALARNISILSVAGFVRQFKVPAKEVPALMTALQSENLGTLCGYFLCPACGEQFGLNSHSVEDLTAEASSKNNETCRYCEHTFEDITVEYCLRIKEKS